MYDELVKKIRRCATDPMHCLSCGEDKDGRCFKRLMTQAADALEEIQKYLEQSKNFEAFWQQEAEEALRRYQVAIANKPRWIPVTERLPEEKDRYLTVSIEPWFGTTVVDTMRWSGVWMYDGRQTEATVTHWMPLPEPPQEE